MFESWMLKQACGVEFSTHKIELLAMIHAFKVWKHDLLGYLFDLHLHLDNGVQATYRQWCPKKQERIENALN